MKISAVSKINYSQPNKQVNFEARKIKSPSKMPKTANLFQVGLAALLLGTAGCQIKNITGPDKKAETEFFVDDAEQTNGISVRNTVRTQTPTFNNSEVGQRLIDWYGNHLGIPIPNKPITGFKYFCPGDQTWHEFKAIVSNQNEFKMVEKVSISGVAYYSLYNSELNGDNEIIHGISTAFISPSEAYNPDYNGWPEPTYQKDRLITNETGSAIQTLSMNDILSHSLIPQSTTQLRVQFPEGGSSIYDNVAFTIKDGAIRPNYTTPMAR